MVKCPHIVSSILPNIGSVRGEQVEVLSKKRGWEIQQGYGKNLVAKWQWEQDHCWDVSLSICSVV